MPAPRRSSRRSSRPLGRSSGRGSRRTSGKRSSAALRKRPSQRLGGSRRMDEEDDDEYFAPQKKNQTPLIIGGVVGGVLFLIIVLALIASSGPADPVDEGPDEVSSQVRDEVLMDKQAKDAMSAAQKWYRKMMSGSDPVQQKADEKRALAEVDKAIDLWTKLHSRHPTYTGIEHDIELATRLRIDIMRSGQW